MSAIVIVGSARADGHTVQVATHLATQLHCQLINLLQESVAPYDYDGAYPAHDNFIELIRERVLPHNFIILASPVYWYTMSAQLKAFVDRFTDLLTTHKPLGRQLRGKQLGVLSCASDAEVNDSFYDAFWRTAGYLGMEYGTEWHGWLGPDGRVELVVREGAGG